MSTPLSLALGLGLVVGGCSPERGAGHRSATPLVEGERPNFLVLVPDSMRADRLLRERDGQAVAPHLAGLAARGVRFEQAVSNAGWTIPALAGFMTGKHARLPRPQSESLGWTAPGAQSFPMILAMYDYRTTGFVGARSDALFGVLGSQCDRVIRADGHEDLALGATAELAAWLEDQPDEPFVALVHDVDLRFVVGLDDLAAWSGAAERCRGARSSGGEPKPLDIVALRACLELDDIDAGAAVSELYDDTLAQYDRGIGEVLRALEGSGMAPRTVVVLASPNGHHLGENGRFEHSTLYEPDLRIPLVWVEPGGDAAGGTVEHRVQLLDLAPTILARAGVPVPVGLDGRSLLAVAELAPGVHPERDAYAFNDVTRFALRAGSYELQRQHPKPRRGPPSREGVRHELYDLAADPFESQNLWTDPPSAIALALSERLAAFEQQVHASSLADNIGAQVSPDPELRQHLKDEGYWRHVEPGSSPGDGP